MLVERDRRLTGVSGFHGTILSWCKRLVTPVVLYPHTGRNRVKAHEETDCVVRCHLAHLGSLCNLCCETPWFLGTSVFCFRLGCRFLVGQIAQETLEIDWF